MKDKIKNFASTHKSEIVYYAQFAASCAMIGGIYHAGYKHGRSVQKIVSDSEFAEKIILVNHPSK